jgi:pimeloyl-ACP methyl ester carboxylesterase
VTSELEYEVGKEDMWGRHWRFWQQLDSINLAKAWQDLNCKVLVLHGGSDFIQCASVEPYLIAETVNKVHKGNATLLTIPGIDHLMMQSKDFPQAVQNMNNKSYLKGNFNRRLLDETIHWLQKL